MRIPFVQSAGRREWGWALGVGAALALVAIAVGGLVGLAGPLIATAALAAVAVALWALTSLEVGLWGTIAIITLLPFAALPVKVVFTPTFLDLALGGVFLVYALQWMTGRRTRLSVTPAHAPIVLFAALAVFSFAAGQPNGPLTTNLLRQFAELLLNIVLALVVVDYVDSQAKLSRLVRVILIGGTLAAALGLALYFAPEAVATRALSALRVVGYPAGDVLRYVEDNPEEPLRAISTSVDPNVLGGMLAMIGGLLAPQLMSRRPALGSRWLSAGAFGLVVACLVLTYSRTAMAGLAAAFLLIAALRYRRLLWVMAAAGLIILVLPATAGYVQRFAEGLQGQDLATQMRLGEYKDAFTLIARYPVLGVGFAGAPDIDVYLGVSSAYLLIAEQMGLVGLGAFALAMAVVFAWAWRAWPAARGEAAGAGRASLWLGVHAGLLAALAVGLVDHYFFKLSFQSAGTLFWLYVGLALAATRLLNQSIMPRTHHMRREFRMDIATQEFKRVSVVTVSGRVDSATAPELEGKLRELVDADKTQLVLDLRNVEYMSSAGLRAMVSTLKAVKRVNGDLRISSPSPRVEEVLRLAGLTSIFNIHSSQEEAVAAF